MIADDPRGAVREGKMVAFLSSSRGFATLLAALVVVSFLPVFLGWESFVYRDFASFGHPLAFHLRESFWRGEFPFWNPFNHCGTPFMAQWNTLVLYPGSILYCLLPFPWSLNLFCLLHLYVGGLGMAYLVRVRTNCPLAAALSGSAYAFSGLTLNSLIWPNVIAALAWAPWVIALCSGAPTTRWHTPAIPALVAALQMLAGSPEVIIGTWLVVITLHFAAFPRQHRLGYSSRLVAIVLLTAGLAACQLLPFAEFLRASQRDPHFGTAEWSMPPWGLANFLVPLFRYYRTDLGVYLQYGQKWTSSYYPGIGIVALAICALLLRRDRTFRALLFLLLLTLCLSLGEAGKLLPWLRKVFPFLGFFRFPVKFVIPAMLALPILAGYGLVAARAPEIGRRRRLALGIVTAALLAFVGGIIAISYFHPYQNERWGDVLGNGVSRALFLLLLTGVLLLSRRDVPPRVRGFLCLSLPVIVAIDGLTHMPWQNPTVTPEILKPSLVQLDPQPVPGAGRGWLTPETFRLLSQNIGSDNFTNYLYHRLGLYPNENLLDRVPMVEGFYSLELAQSGMVGFLLTQPTPGGPPDGVLDFLGISQVLISSNGFAWRARSNALPMVTAGQTPVFARPMDSYRGLLDPAFDPRKIVYLPVEASASVRPAGPDRIKKLESKVTSRRVAIEIETDNYATVVLAQSFYGPWKALVDGNPARLWLANGGFQALQVPPGAHRVEVIYRDTLFQIGLVISGLSLAVVGWLWRWRERKPVGSRGE